MTTTIKNVIVIGAGGNLASILIPALLKANFDVSAVIQPSSQAIFPEQVQVHKAKYDDYDSLLSAFQGQDAVISTIGTFYASIQKTAVDAAAAAKVKRFIPSEYGGDTSAPDRVSFARFPVEKRKIVEHLQRKEADGLTWTAICTGSFINWLLELENSAMGWDLRAQKATLFDSGNASFDVSTLDQVLRSIISTLQHFNETKNTYIYTRSFTFTQAKLLKTIETMSGKKFDLTEESTQEIAARGSEHLKKGDLERGYPEVVTAVGYGPWGFLDFKERGAKWNTILELPEEDPDVTIREVLRKKNLV